MTEKARRWNVPENRATLWLEAGRIVKEQNAVCLDSSGHEQVLQQDGAGGTGKVAFILLG